MKNISSWGKSALCACFIMCSLVMFKASPLNIYSKIQKEENKGNDYSQSETSYYKVPNGWTNSKKMVSLQQRERQVS